MNPMSKARALRIVSTTAVLAGLGLAAPAPAHADSEFTSFICPGAATVDPQYGGTYDNATQWANQLVTNLESWGAANLEQVNADYGESLTSPADVLSFAELFGSCDYRFTGENAWSQLTQLVNLVSAAGAPVPGDTDIRMAYEATRIEIQASFNDSAACVTIPLPDTWAEVASNGPAVAATGSCADELPQPISASTTAFTVTKADSTTFHITFNTTATTLDYVVFGQGTQFNASRWTQIDELGSIDTSIDPTPGFDVTVPLGETDNFVVAGRGDTGGSAGWATQVETSVIQIEN